MLAFLTLVAGCDSVAVPFDPAANGDDGDDIAAPTGSADWTVDCNGGGDFDEIGDAITAAADGDWIIVEDCEYTERLNYNGKSLYIQSRNGSGSTTINAASGGYAVQVSNGETSETALVGFTISNARGAAVYAELASIHLEDIVFTDTTGEYVIYGYGADLEVKDSVFTNNAETTAVIATSRGGVDMSGSTVECGRSSIAFYWAHGAGMVDNSTVDCGRGYAGYFEHTTGHIMRSVLTGNIYSENEDDHPEDSFDLYNTVLTGSYSAVYGSFAFKHVIVDGGRVDYTNNVEYPGVNEVYNSVLMNSNCAFNVDLTTLTVANSAFWDTAESCEGTALVDQNGNIGNDPQFVDANSGDYHLDRGSPLIDAGDSAVLGADVDGSDADIGIYGGPFTQDGGW